MIYNNLKRNTNSKVEVQNKPNIHFVKGPFVEIKGPKEANYKV